jgi:hypothetical protein
LTFIDKQKKTYKSEETFYRESYDVNVPAGAKNSFHYDIQLRDSELKGFSYNKQMNPYPNLEDLNLLMPTLKTNLISCEYSIKVTAYFSIFTPHDCRPRIDLPLFVTAQTIDDYKAEERQMEIAKILAALNSQKEKLQEFNKACETGPGGFFQKLKERFE